MPTIDDLPTNLGPPNNDNISQPERDRDPLSQVAQDRLQTLQENGYNTPKALNSDRIQYSESPSAEDELGALMQPQDGFSSLAESPSVEDELGELLQPPKSTTSISESPSIEDELGALVQQESVQSTIKKTSVAISQEGAKEVHNALIEKATSVQMKGRIELVGFHFASRKDRDELLQGKPRSLRIVSAGRMNEVDDPVMVAVSDKNGAYRFVDDVDEAIRKALEENRDFSVLSDDKKLNLHDERVFGRPLTQAERNFCENAVNQAIKNWVEKQRADEAKRREDERRKTEREGARVILNKEIQDQQIVAGRKLEAVQKYPLENRVAKISLAYHEVGIKDEKVHAEKMATRAQKAVNRLKHFEAKREAEEIISTERDKQGVYEGAVKETQKRSDHLRNVAYFPGSAPSDEKLHNAALQVVVAPAA